MCCKFTRILFSFSIAVGIASTVASAHAQGANSELKGFWQKGDAANWNNPVRENSSAAVNYRDYPLAVDRMKAETQAAAAQPGEPAIDQSSPPSAPSQPMTREQIIAKHGAPEMPRPIRAAKDSPPEMQGLFDALNAGDKELAWQYSLALARRNLEIQKTVSKATDYQMLAMEALGMRPADNSAAQAEVANPIRQELQALIERTKAEQAKANGMIDAEVATAAGTGVDAWADPAAGQAAAVAQAAPNVPVDPAGKVKVLVFFDERGASARSFSETLRPLKEKFKADSSVSIVGLTKRNYEIPTLKTLGATTNFPFPLLNGEALAQELQIHTYPAVVFVAVTSKQTYKVDGAASAEEIARIVTLMKGRPVR